MKQSNRNPDGTFKKGISLKCSLKTQFKKRSNSQNGKVLKDENAPAYKHGLNRDVSNNAKRGLGTKPINRRRKGRVMHHIDKMQVLYVPKDLHESVSHSIKTGKNMKKINRLAFKWLDSVTTLSQRSLFEFR